MKKLRYQLFTIRDGNGNIHYEVSRKGWIFWTELKDHDWWGYSSGPRRFATVEQALLAIKDDARTMRTEQYSIIACEEISA